MITVPDTCIINNIEQVKQLISESLDNSKAITLDCVQLDDFDSSFVQLYLSLKSSGIDVQFANIPEHLADLFSLFKLQ